MNAVISLNHFCEIHGPQVVFSTQTFHDKSPLNTLTSQETLTIKRKFYGNPEIIHKAKIIYPECEACRSLDDHVLGFLSSDHEAKISYISSQHSLSPTVVHLTKQACLRSLSCELTKETSSAGDQPVFFGDQLRGQVLSIAFKIQDSQARGSRRLFSICVLMKDALFLLQAWPFLTNHIKIIIGHIQKLASTVYAKEEETFSQRASRLNPGPTNDTQLKQNKVTRSLIELTQEPCIYQKLHVWFVWLLKFTATRLQEKLVLPKFLQDSNINWGTETEEGFVLVPIPCVSIDKDNSENAISELEASGSSIANSNVLFGPQLNGGITELYKCLGHSQFVAVAHCLLIGHQVVIRCEWPSLASGIIQALKSILTRAIYRAKLWSVTYQPLAVCSIIALPMSATLPTPTPSNVLILEIFQKFDVKYDEDKPINEKLIFSVRSGGHKVPTKLPTLLIKIDKALQNTFLTPSALHCHLVALKEEWLNISRTVMRLHQTGTSANDLSSLMATLGANSHDWPLINHWGS